MPKRGLTPDDELWWHCSEDEWYASSVKHWTACDDVLGGCEGVHDVDVAGSLQYLTMALGSRWAAHGADDPPPMAGSAALDLGAGCGRVTGGLLLRVFATVHMVEVSETLLAKAREDLSQHASRLDMTQASLQSFAPTCTAAYDTIWMQWILGHITDTSVVRLLRACQPSLKPGGFIVVKENNAGPRLCQEGNGNYLIDQVPRPVDSP